MWEFANRTLQFGSGNYSEMPSLFYPHIKYTTLGIPSPVDISGQGRKCELLIRSP